GKYGILEPHPDTPEISPEEVDLILVPCIACDYQGYRLGYGAGYYDRMFSKPEWSNKFSVGIVYDFALLPQLPADAWDKPLKAVLTENGVFDKR
ncbi:MAG: 5-formyltetrahydrofolate cyclo-ligase, partial [Calothrix sp. SM1_7_51]|nr:5-formyltetrahydrofolate cyclo-ligase [Calothrix sp. SM1_7_51]